MKRVRLGPLFCKKNIAAGSGRGDSKRAKMAESQKNQIRKSESLAGVAKGSRN
jgi:hypothetical protein